MSNADHDHEIFHLSDLDRRKFLKVAGFASSLGLLGNLVSSTDAIGATTVKLAGFSAFSNSVKVFRSGKYYLVESSGIPDHQMMVGIKSWQQQVPTVQPYSGSNAWSIPITPVISSAPMSAKTHFLRGAIAIAVNGVPIFNALNNRGDDALLAGELDDWGGHCGRADDYHYHIAPLHLQSIVGVKAPIAYALDGYPIYGETEVKVITCGPISMDLDKYQVKFNEELLDLSPTEFKLLEQLILHRGNVVTKEALLSEVWEIDFKSSSTVVDTYISYLRRKLIVFGFEGIKTVRGIGFQIVPD